MTSWTSTKLGELVSITRGATYKSLLLDQPGPVLLGLASIRREGGFRSDKLRTYGGDSPAKLLVHPGQLYASLKDVTQSGDLLGSVARLPKDGPVGRLSQDTVRLDLISDRVDPGFLYLSLLSPTYRAWCRQHATGTTTLGLPRDAFLAYEVPHPVDATHQRAISSVLNAVDELIENNGQRVEALEQMMRAIYREWFVKFRYPGHGDVPMVDSALGPIPEGWKVSTCGDELNFIGGGTPSKKEASYWDGGTVPWYTPSDLTKTGWRYAAASGLYITEQGVARSSARLFPAGSVMMTSRATLGVLAIATTEATTNQGFIVVLPDERWSAGFIYEWLDSKAGELAALGTGATFKEITKGSFKGFPFVVPAPHVLKTFSAATQPIEAEVRVLEQQTRALRELRDLLLPKLVTGQVDLPMLDLDALVEGAVA